MDLHVLRAGKRLPHGTLHGGVLGAGCAGLSLVQEVLDVELLADVGQGKHVADDLLERLAVAAQLVQGLGEC